MKGFFERTLPNVQAERFALIRLDGDMYQSTMDALTNLYPMLSPGGFAVIDDYGARKNCKRAVHDFLDHNRLSPDIQAVDGQVVW